MTDFKFKMIIVGFILFIVGIFNLFIIPVAIKRNGYEEIIGEVINVRYKSSNTDHDGDKTYYYYVSIRYRYNDEVFFPEEEVFAISSSGGIKIGEKAFVYLTRDTNEFVLFDLSSNSSSIKVIVIIDIVALIIILLLLKPTSRRKRECYERRAYEENRDNWQNQ